MKCVLLSSQAIVAHTTDAWSSVIHRGFMKVTTHWVETEWNLKYTIWEFNSFVTSHTGEEACELIYDIFINWDLYHDVSSIMTENASEMIKGVELLRLKL